MGDVPVMQPYWVKTNTGSQAQRSWKFLYSEANSLPHTPGFLQPEALMLRVVKLYVQSHTAHGWQALQMPAPPQQTPSLCTPQTLPPDHELFSPLFLFSPKPQKCTEGRQG